MHYASTSRKLEIHVTCACIVWDQHTVSRVGATIVFTVLILPSSLRLSMYTLYRQQLAQRSSQQQQYMQMHAVHVSDCAVSYKALQCYRRVH
jgi:hypothetical protein